MRLILGRPRSLTARAAVLACAAGLVATPAPAASAGAVGAAADRSDPVRLSADGGGVVRSAEVRLGSERWRPTRDGRTTAPMTTTRYEMVAVTWRGPDPGAQVRSRQQGRWGPWTALEPLTDGPTRGTDEARRATVAGASGAAGASQLLWVGPSDGVQLRTEVASPQQVDLVLLDPGQLASDEAPASLRSTSAGTMARAPATRAPRPKLHTRRDWRADDSWRNGSPRYLNRFKQVHIHHTATGNGYSRADVPGILRGMYRYHTKTLGWFDLGYNFLVDRFGRAWVGRSGGPNRLVRGAHTLGFNGASTGIAVIGNKQTRGVGTATMTKLVRLSAWKFDKYGRDSQRSVVMTSQGSDKYPDGRRVRLTAIDGHRDTNDTACPGQRLYDELRTLRRRTQGRIDRW